MAMNYQDGKMIQKRSAFSLIELMVALAILATATMIAIRSVDGVQSQARYQQTTRQLDDVRDAIISPANQSEPDGTRSVTGFVADMGRLPRAIGSDPLTQLQELWIQPTGSSPFGIRSPAFDSNVKLASGWRGPYLQLSTGKTELRDGWGNAFDLLKADQTTFVSNGDAIEVLRSQGSDKSIDTILPVTKDYSTDVYVGLNVASLPTNASHQTVTYAAPVGNRYQSQIGGNVSFYDSTSGMSKVIDHNKGNVIVYFYGVDPNTGGVNSTAYTFALSTDQNYITFTIPNVPIGPCVIRAYQGTSMSTVSDAIYKSQIVRLVLMPGGQVKDLVLQ